jgi:hypothetical protein
MRFNGEVKVLLKAIKKQMIIKNGSLGFELFFTEDYALLASIPAQTPR